MKPVVTEKAHHGTALVDDPNGMSLDFNIFSEIISQQSCLAALSQTFQHEDLVVLSDDNGQTSLAKQHLVHRVIPFKDLISLRTTLGVSDDDHVAPTAVLSPPPVGPTSHEAPSESPRSNAKNHSETHTITVDPEINSLAQPAPKPDTDAPPQVVLPTEDRKAETEQTRPTMTLKEAVLRLQAARSIRMRKLRPPPPPRAPQLPDFVEGQLYELYDGYSESFPKLGKKTAEKARDRISPRLVRGPCLYIVLALRMLVEEIDEYGELLDQELQTPGLDPNGLAEIQLKKTKAKEQRGKVNEWVPHDATPKLLKASNLAGIKTQTGNAWNSFMLVKNSGILPQNDAFKIIEQLASRGRDIVLDAAKRFGKSR